ncbi:type I methionyl aminopeptidase, partial [Streptomyces sp. NPDC007157]
MVTPGDGNAVGAHRRRPEYVGKPAPSPYTGPEVQTPETIEAM